MKPARVLVAGWINSPHVIAWADALLELGYDVHLAGEQPSRWPALRDTGRFASVHALEPGGVRGIKDRRLGRGLAVVAGRLRPNLVHAHWVPGYAWMAARAGLRPLVTSAWGSDLLLGGRRLQMRSRRALRASDLVLADSAHLARAAERVAGKPIRVELVQWGVDLVRYRPDPASREATRRALGLDGAPTVLTTRALDELYNPEVLLRAVALARGRVPGLRLVLKHPGAELPPRVQAALRDLDLEAVTRVVGFVDDDQLAGLYRAADAFVSIPSSDSSPRSVWEAMACAAPVVVSDLPWAREALRDREHGILVPPAVDPVASALVTLLNNPEEARRMGSAGRDLAAATMDRTERLARLDALYAELLSRA